MYENMVAKKANRGEETRELYSPTIAWKTNLELFVQYIGKKVIYKRCLSTLCTALRYLTVGDIFYELLGGIDHLAQQVAADEWKRPTVLLSRGD